jgi:hypothetical protein
LDFFLLAPGTGKRRKVRSFFSDNHQAVEDKSKRKIGFMAKEKRAVYVKRGEKGELNRWLSLINFFSN